MWVGRQVSIHVPLLSTPDNSFSLVLYTPNDAMKKTHATDVHCLAGLQAYLTQRLSQGYLVFLEIDTRSCTVTSGSKLLSCKPGMALACFSQVLGTAGLVVFVSISFHHYPDTCHPSQQVFCSEERPSHTWGSRVLSSSFPHVRSLW